MRYDLEFGGGGISAGNTAVYLYSDQRYAAAGAVDMDAEGIVLWRNFGFAGHYCDESVRGDGSDELGNRLFEGICAGRHTGGECETADAVVAAEKKSVL